MVPHLKWFSISGPVGSGKSLLVEKLVNFLVTKKDEKRFQICGFSQPSKMIGDERDGYLLTIYTKFTNDLDQLPKFQTIDFATINYNSQPGEIPYTFDRNGFEDVLNQARTVEFSKSNLVLIIDEFARLELQGQGHYDAIQTWLTRIQQSTILKNVSIVVSFNDRRKDEISSLLAGFGCTDFGENIPLHSENENQFFEQVISF